MSVICASLNGSVQCCLWSVHLLMRSIPHRCVTRVVERQVDVWRAEGRPNSEEEKRLLEQLGKEADQWVKQALLLLVKVEGDKQKEEEKDESQKKSSPAEVEVW